MQNYSESFWAVQILLVLHPKLFGLTLRGCIAAFWLLLKCRMSGTEISDTLRNIACSWLAHVESEPLLLFWLCRQGNNANIIHLMSLLCLSYYILIYWLKQQLCKFATAFPEYSWIAIFKTCTSLSSSYCRADGHTLTLAPICLTYSRTAFAINLVCVAGCPFHVN